jgi:hypothetical protein
MDAASCPITRIIREIGERLQVSLGHHAAEFALRHYRKSVTARHQAAVEELDRKLKVVPIKTGAA